MLDFTIAIPTYNGFNRLPAVVDKLKAETGKDNRKSAKRVDPEIRINFWERFSEN
ncbi:MAG: hypothetical protein GDA44_06115 [Prochloron sp. SP5CPC1]|nr:hypothetical protein [Candidatus Paraprochloron terpiosi SP5CPC1]